MKPKGTLWSASALLDTNYHELLLDTHLDFIKAGAEVIVTTSFATRKIRLLENKIEDKFEYLNKKAGEIAQNTKRYYPNVLIAGGLPPQNLTYKPDIINNGFLVRRQVINDFVWYSRWDQKSLKFSAPAAKPSCR